MNEVFISPRYTSINLYFILSAFDYSFFDLVELSLAQIFHTAKERLCERRC